MRRRECAVHAGNAVDRVEQRGAMTFTAAGAGKVVLVGAW